MTPARSLPAAAGLLASSILLAADAPPAWVTQGPYVDAPSLALEVPLEVLGNRLFVEVELGGHPRRFLFDTGSPSMMDAPLADALGLEVIDRRQGRDAHGAIVETRVGQSDLVVGGTTFRKVPVFVADFPETARCLFDGVLGSEVLPLCAWQIDLPESALRCSSDLGRLAHIDEAARQPLHTFGYPHAPFLEVRFAEKANSKALFDTGSPEYIAVSPPDLEGAKRNRAVGRTVPGSGSIGGSLGGPAPEADQHMVQLQTLSLGSVALGPVAALARESSPSLIGAAVLEHFVVTLDARSASAYFAPYRGGPYARAAYGFGLSFHDGVRVALVWEGSPADRAGMRVGQRVVAINGEPVDPPCPGIRNALRAVSQGDRIDLRWEGGGATLTRQLPFAK